MIKKDAAKIARKIIRAVMLWVVFPANIVNPVICFDAKKIKKIMHTIIAIQGQSSFFNMPIESYLTFLFLSLLK